MQRLFSSFPAGAAGIALIILRLCVAGTLLDSAIAHTDNSVPSAIFVFLCVIAVCLGFGILTPLCCVLVLLAQLTWLHAGASQLSPRNLLDLSQAASLALLGPGAYSIDARLYGRRVVVIPK